MSKESTRETEILEAPAGTDPDWQKKIELAVRAREQAAEARKGKTASFRASSRLLIGERE